MGALVELVFALIVLTIGTVTVVKAKVEHERGQVLAAEGEHIALINRALGKYQSDHRTALVNGQPVSGFAKPLEPTVAELANAKYLAASSYRVGPFWGGTYQTRIVLGTSPAGCTVVQGGSPGCMPTLAAMMWTTRPLTRRGLPDVEGAGQVAAAGGAQLGFSATQAAGTIAGLNGRFSAPNPQGNQAATIAAVSGDGTDANAVYYRRDGSLPLTGPLAGGGQDINSVHDVNASGTVATTDLKTTGDNYLLGTAVPGTRCDGKDGAVRRNGLTGAGLVECSGNVWQPVGTALPNVVAGTACSMSGQLATSTNNVGYICNNRNVYVPLSNTLSNFVVAWRQQVGDGETIGKPACGAGGTPEIMRIPQSMGVDLTQSPAYESMVVKANDVGWAWVSQISMIQAHTGALRSGNDLGLRAEMVVGCRYQN